MKPIQIQAITPDKQPCNKEMIKMQSDIIETQSNVAKQTRTYHIHQKDLLPPT